MRVRVIGAGAYVPPLVVPNARLVKAIPGPNHKPWTADEVELKTGIRERRFCLDFDEDAGKAIYPPGYGSPPGPSGEIAEKAIREALDVAGIAADELDGLYYVSCTPDRLNFSQDALLIHRRLGMRPDAFVEHKDTGCGGALFNVQLAQEMILSGCRKTIAVIGVNVTSPYLDRDVFTREIDLDGKKIGAFLTMYLFGDGAGAVILRGDSGGPSGIVASFAENEYLDLVLRPGGAALHPPGPATGPERHGYYVVGPLVAQCFGPYMKRSVETVLSRAGLGIGDISRFFLHQANKRLVEQFARSMGIPDDRLSMHMERYGNCSAAGTLILLGEDVRNGVVTLGGGDPVLMAAIGAGAQSAAHVISL